MSLFSRRRKPAVSSVSIAPVQVRPARRPVIREVSPDPRYFTLKVSADVKDAEGKPRTKWWHQTITNLPRSMAPVAVGVTTPSGYTKIRQGDRFYKPAAPERMESNSIWIVRHLGTLDSDLQAHTAAMDTFSRHIIVGSSLWVKIHDPYITVGPNGLTVHLVPINEEPPLQVPLRTYALDELSKARAVVKALPEFAAICTEVTLTDAIDWERVARRRRADALERVKSASRTDSPGTPTVQSLAELIAKLPPEAMREAAQILIKAADAAER